MKIVADTNALVAVLLDEPEANAIIRVTTGHEVVAPTSVRYEVGNALVNARRRGRRSLDELNVALQSFQMMSIAYKEVDIAASVQIADKTGLMAYDAYLLYCAIDNESPLLTLDKRLRRAAEQLGVRILEVNTENERNPGT